MLYTIGHSNRTFAQLVTILKAHSISMIADVRGGRAGSRTFPHFNKENLQLALPEAGVLYRHFPNLGGRRRVCKAGDTSFNNAWRLPAFKNYADYAYYSGTFNADCRELIGLSTDINVAYMCSEAVPWRCHRSIITDYMTLIHNVDVVHLLSESQTLVGRAHDFAKVCGDKVIYPGEHSETN